MLQFTLIVVALFALSGCSNEANTEIHLGAVSVGQQLVDLEAARSAGAITEAEYKVAKASILQMVDEIAATLD